MAKVAPAPAKGLYRPRIASLSVSDRVVEAVSASKERGGMSLHVVKKTLAAGGYDVDKNKFRVKTAIKRLVAKGTLVQLKGTGAVGSFRINKDKHEVKARVSQPAKKPPDLLSGKIEYPEDWQQQEHSIKDGDSPFPVVWEVLNGLLWRRPITPSSSSADKEEEEDSLPAPTIEILFTPAMDQGQQTFLAETVVCIKEEPEDFEFEGCGDIPLPSQPGQNHTKTNTSASQPGHHLKQHSGEKPYSCSFCGKQFAYGKSCRTHERNHVAMGYQCSDCGETFREREQKDRHKCLVFKGETVFPCTECTEVFSRRYLLKKHQLEFHPEICVETSQSPHTEMDRMNPADTVDQAMDERKEEEEELFDPGELVPSSLGLLEMDEMVQPGFSCKW